ncbi:MAG: hypothetical protein HYT28_01990 [Parcubacteria group bacterium]|nr:hypothetical protein [Parcubacteria group bacterium]
MTTENKNYFAVISAGIFVGAALFDALPETAKTLGFWYAILGLAVGMFLWWLQKNILHQLEKPEMPILVTTALWLHSILEGVVTGLAFGVSNFVGSIVLIAMILHLLPEFFAAVSLMKGGGASNRAALFTTVAGYAILFSSFFITRAYLPSMEGILPVMIALSGGAFLYIGTKVYLRNRSFQSTLIFLVGVLIPLIQKIISG